MKQGWKHPWVAKPFVALPTDRQNIYRIDAHLWGSFYRVALLLKNISLLDIPHWSSLILETPKNVGKVCLGIWHSFYKVFFKVKVLDK